MPERRSWKPALTAFKPKNGGNTTVTQHPSPRDLGEIRNLTGRLANARKQGKAVGADRIIRVVHKDFLEECVGDQAGTIARLRRHSRYALFDAEEDEFMSITVPTRKTRMRVWINHPTEPDEVVIAVGE